MIIQLLDRAFENVIAARFVADDITLPALAVVEASMVKVNRLTPGTFFWQLLNNDRDPVKAGSGIV